MPAVSDFLMQPGDERRANAEPALTPDDVRAINRAAAYLDGVLAISYNEKRALAKQLFAIAGNPMPLAPTYSAKNDAQATGASHPVHDEPSAEGY